MSSGAVACNSMGGWGPLEVPGRGGAIGGLTRRVVGRAWESGVGEPTIGPSSRGHNMWPHKSLRCWSFSAGYKWCAGSGRTCDKARRVLGQDDVEKSAVPAEKDPKGSCPVEARERRTW